MSDWPLVGIFVAVALGLYFSISALVEWQWKRRNR